MILIEAGKVRPVRGHLSNCLLSEFGEVAESAGIDYGLITVARAGQGTVLRFSGPFDVAAKQRFRNIWFAQPVRKV